jgi:hypothetical protein
MTILLIFFVVGGALYLMGRYDSTQRQSEQQFDLKESLWYSLNVILQGESNEMKNKNTTLSEQFQNTTLSEVFQNTTLSEVFQNTILSEVLQKYHTA